MMMEGWWWRIIGQSEKGGAENGMAKVKVEMEIDGEDGMGRMEIADLTEVVKPEANGEIRVKEEEVDAASVEKVLDW